MGLQGGDNPAYNNTPAQRKIARKKSFGRKKNKKSVVFGKKTTDLSDVWCLFTAVGPGFLIGALGVFQRAARGVVVFRARS